MSELKERRWDLMEVNEEFGPLEVDVSEQLVRNFAYAVDDFSQRYLYDDTARMRTGHPTLLCREARDVVRTKYDIASGGVGLHAKHEVRIAACPPVGAKVEITGRHVEKYVRRGRRYIVLESEVRGGEGEVLMHQRSTHCRTVNSGPSGSGTDASGKGRRQSGPTVIGSSIAETSADLAVGSQLRPVTKQPSQEQVTVFAGADWPNVHNDLEVAQNAGFQNTIVSGLQTMAYVSELMDRYCGEGWRTGGHCAVAFIAPVQTGELVHTSGKVTTIERSGGRWRLEADVWCENDVGTRVLVGRAKGWLAG